MVQQVVLAGTYLAILGSALIAGLLFAFSVAVMTALGRLTPPQGIQAMQAVNVAIVNPLFLAVFLGTAALSLALAVAALLGAAGAGARLGLVLGAALYLAGVIGVTAACNIPRNEALAALDPAGVGAAANWARYLAGWTGWNHVRSLAAASSTLAFAHALWWLGRTGRG